MSVCDNCRNCGVELRTVARGLCDTCIRDTIQSPIESVDGPPVDWKKEAQYYQNEAIILQNKLMRNSDQIEKLKSIIKLLLCED